MPQHNHRFFYLAPSEHTQQTNEFNLLIDNTLAFIKIHNAAVNRLYKMQYKAEECRMKLTNHSNTLTNDERNTLLQNLQNFEAREQRFLENLNQTQSAEIIEANLEKIEQLHNELNPQHRINLNNDSVELERLRLR